MDERKLGREFSNESVGYTQSVLNEIDRQMDTAGDADKAVLESEREFVKNNLPDFLSSFESIKTDLLPIPAFSEAIQNKDVPAVTKIFQEKAVTEAENFKETYAKTLARDLERFSKYDKVWEFLNK